MSVITPKVPRLGVKEETMEFVDPDPAEYERRCLAALEGTRAYQMRSWNEALQEHRACRSFHTEGWAHEREIGFSCSCHGDEQVWRIPLTDVRAALPGAMELFRGMRQAEFGYEPNDPAAERAQKKANKRAKALLHRHLTKEQRLHLRATDGFSVIGQNGKTYRIEHGSCRNVFLMIGGEKRVLYCIVPAEERVPVYDLMLAQKVMLQSNIKEFFKHAATELVVRRSPLTARRARRARRRGLPYDEFAIPIARHDMDNPAQWADERLALARAANTGDAR
jgi:hypothetical protein